VLSITWCQMNVFHVTYRSSEVLVLSDIRINTLKERDVLRVSLTRFFVL